MLGLDRRAARYAWTILVVILLLAVFYLVRKTLFVFIIAILLAYLLSPLVDLLDRVLPASRTRAPALAAAYVIVLGLVVLAGAQIGSRVVEEANSLTKRVPELLKQWEQPTSAAPAPVNSLKEQIISKVRQQIMEHSSDILALLPKAGLTVLNVAGDLIYVIVIPILSFFFLKDGRRIRQHVVELFEEGTRRDLLNDVLADVHLLLAHYMRALFILCLATFVCYSIFFALIGVPYGILLAALAFALEFIPMLGPLTAAIVIVLVAGLNGANVLPILIFLGVYRLFQDYILSPHLMGAGVEIHPLLVIFGVFAGAEIAGIPGTFLSVPVLALLRIVYLRLRKARLAARFHPVSSL